METPAGTPPSLLSGGRVPTLWPPVISSPGWSLADTFPLLRNTPRPLLPKPLPLQCREARRPLSPAPNEPGFLTLSWLSCSLSLCTLPPPPPWQPLLQMTVFLLFPGSPHTPAQWAQDLVPLRGWDPDLWLLLFGSPTTNPAVPDVTAPRCLGPQTPRSPPLPGHTPTPASIPHPPCQRESLVACLGLYRWGLPDMANLWPGPQPPLAWSLQPLLV